MNLHDITEAGLTQARTAPESALLLHPLVLFRFAGEPADALKAISNGDAAAMCRQIDALAADSRADAAALSAALEALVPGAYALDADGAKLLLRLKRDLFNLRPSRIRADDVAQFLTLDLCERVNALAARIDALQLLKSAYPAAYAGDIEHAKRGLRAQFGGSNIRQGILHTDLDVFRDLDRFFGARTVYKKKKEKVLENTFMNFLARTTLKTTPMSAMTPILEGRWQAGAGAGLKRSYAGWRLTTRTSLRKGLVHAFVAPLLNRAPAGDRLLCLNPGVRDDGRVLKLLDVTPWNACWGVAPALTQVTRSVVLLALLSVLAQAEGGRLSAAAIVQRLQGVLPAQVHAGLPALVERLVASRLLVVYEPFGEQEDSMAWAERVLAGIEGEQAAFVLAGLRELAVAVQRHAQAHGDARIASAGAIEAALQRLLAQAECLTPERLQPVYYEDCKFADPDPRFDPALLAPVEAELDALLRLSHVFDDYGRFQTDLANRFVQAYGTDGVCSDVEAFLESAADPLGARVGAPAPTVTAPHLDLDPVLAAIRHDVDALLYARYCEGGDIVLTPADLQPFIERIPAPLHARTVSYSFHAQFFGCDGDDYGLVLNKTYPGHSVMYSRFLDPAPACPPAIAAYLRTLSGTAQYLEVPGVFGLNTNTHPPLAAAEIGLAPYAPNYRDVPRVPLADLTLRYDARRHRVCLRGADGRDYDPLFFGMSVSFVLPKLQRVLGAMTMQSGMTLGSEVLKSVLARAREFDPQQVLRIPRLRLGKLVLGRRTAHIPAALFPPAHEEESEFFFALQQWRRDLDLPNEGFIQLSAHGLERPRMRPTAADGKQRTERPKRFKPFYIDFDNPMLVRLFHRALRANPARLVFQEALPGSQDQWLDIDGRRHVAEMQFEASLKGN